MKLSSFKNAVVGAAVTVGLLAGSVAALPATAFAQAGVAPGQGIAKATSNLSDAGSKAGLGQSSLPLLVGNIINIALSLLGLIFLILGIYAGFKWMTAQGEEGDVEKAKDTLKNAIIGLIIVLASYAISSYVVSSIISAAQ